jgi:3-dehydroquinate dehydratase
MRSSSREEVVGVFDGLRAGFKRALDLRCDALTTPERLALLQSCEEIRRLLPAVEHPLINQLRAQADSSELGGKLADRLRITRAEASRRIHDAADLDMSESSAWAISTGRNRRSTNAHRSCPASPEHWIRYRLERRPQS